MAGPRSATTTGRGPTTHSGHRRTGTAGSVLDLNDLLPARFISSEAYSLDAAGDVYGIAFDVNAQNYHAVKWVLVPESSAFSPLALAAAVMWPRRRRLRPPDCGLMA